MKIEGTLWREDKHSLHISSRQWENRQNHSQIDRMKINGETKRQKKIYKHNLGDIIREGEKNVYLYLFSYWK